MEEWSEYLTGKKITKVEEKENVVVFHLGTEKVKIIPVLGYSQMTILPKVIIELEE